MSPNLFPPRGQDPQLDNVRKLIEGSAMGDPEALRFLIAYILRWARDNMGLPGIPLPSDACKDVDGEGAIVWAINPETRTAIILAAEGASRQDLFDRLKKKMPKAKTGEIDFSTKGKRKQ
jgi:hypothetical protein